METMAQIETEENTYPSLIKRYKSYFIDILSVIVVMFLLSELFSAFPGIPDGLKVFLYLAPWILYEPVSTTLGCTLGNYVMDIRVRKMSAPDQKINILQAYVRFILKYSLGYISFFTIGSNRERRAIHDLVSGSVMLERNK